MKKTSRILISVLTFAFIFSMAFQAFAANKFVGVSLFPQPDPNAKSWTENADGSMTAAIVDSKNVNVTSIAYVPESYDASKPKTNMPADIVTEFEMMIPNDSKQWSGMYLRATAPQTGTGGYLFFFNKDGMGLLDGESGSLLVDEKVGGDFVKAGQFNKIRIEAVASTLRVFINDKFVYKKKSAMNTRGYIGFSTIGYKTTIKNLKMLCDGVKYYSVLNANPIFQGTAPAAFLQSPPETTTTPSSNTTTPSKATSTPASTGNNTSSVDGNNNASSVGTTSDNTSVGSTDSNAVSSDATVSSTDSQQTSEDETDKPATNGVNPLTIVLIIVAVLVVGGAVAAGIIFLKKKN